MLALLRSSAALGQLVSLLRWCSFSIVKSATPWPGYLYRHAPELYFQNILKKFVIVKFDWIPRRCWFYFMSFLLAYRCFFSFLITNILSGLVFFKNFVEMHQFIILVVLWFLCFLIWVLITTQMKQYPIFCSMYREQRQDLAFGV